MSEVRQLEPLSLVLQQLYSLAPLRIVCRVACNHLSTVQVEREGNSGGGHSVGCRGFTINKM